jgi:putative tryptophan/tyrosine transport system substrate-binding protein
MATRRKILIALGASALAAPLASFAQSQGKVWRVGFLGAGMQPTAANPDSRAAAFVSGMRDLGYVEGKNLKIEWRFAGGKSEPLTALARELAELKVDVIVTNGTPAVHAAQSITATIPIVAASFADPVASGFAASLSRPGGNITGLSNLGEVIYGKRLEILSSMVPGLRRIAWLVNPENAATMRLVPGLLAIGQKRHQEIVLIKVRAASEIEAAFALITKEHPGAVMMADDAVLNGQGTKIAELALRQRLPAIFANREIVEAGGLMNYGVEQNDTYRRVAGFVNKIFKGAKPGDIPIEQPTKFELFINNKTAKALGLKIPQSLLISADKVIE